MNADVNPAWHFLHHKIACSAVLALRCIIPSHAMSLNTRQEDHRSLSNDAELAVGEVGSDPEFLSFPGHDKGWRKTVLNFTPSFVGKPHSLFLHFFFSKEKELLVSIRNGALANYPLVNFGNQKVVLRHHGNRHHFGSAVFAPL